MSPGALSLFRRPEQAPASERVAIIDIGSNSIRLVVYDGPGRAPSVLFNEKVLAGLGAGLARNGRIGSGAAERAVAALRRFALLARQMEVRTIRTVATAAVRDASNGTELLERIVALGLTPELLSGDEEAVMAGWGVLAAIPDADGIVGDLGGGSLELIRIANGKVGERASFPLGVLRLGAIRSKGPRALDTVVASALKKADWTRGAARLPFYMVGGSWRTLARFDMHLTGHPLPIVHHYTIDPGRVPALIRTLARTDKRRLRVIEGVAAQRTPTLPDAAALLSILARRLKSARLIVSAFGLREGLLHAALPEAARAEDPLIVAVRDEGRRQGRFPEHGDLLFEWIAPLFADETADQSRLRHAAALLGDIGWRAHPEFRAERGLETALHGNWVGIDAEGRALTAHALWVSFGGQGVHPAVRALAPAPAIELAGHWGLALRLGQRLSGGVAGALRASGLTLEEGALVLSIGGADVDLCGESVVRRHKALAAAYGRVAVLRTAP